MLAKLISWAPNRLEAIQRLQRALAKTTLEGPIHNAGFLERLLLNPKVIEGDYTTHFIEKEKILELPQKQKRLIKAISALIHHLANGSDHSGEWVVVEDGKGALVSFEDDGVVVEGEALDLDLFWYPRERHFVATLHGQSYYGQVCLEVMGLRLTLFGREHSFQMMLPKVWNLYAHIKLPDSLPDNLIVKAPMPGILVSLAVSVGDPVKLGQTLLVIEAMKMENALTSPTEGIVTDILVQQGDSLVRNQVLVKLG
jgi:propionyl-CoA carboxylase alpha chain